MMNGAVAQARPREIFGAAHCAAYLVEVVGAFREGVFSAAQASFGAAYALPMPHDELFEPTFLLATTLSRWAASTARVDGDAGAWRRIAMATLDLVQTTMAREAGRMP